MRSTIIFIIALSISGLSMAQTKELSPEAREIVFQAIADHVYAEKNDLVRAPQKISDFNYHYLSPEKALVTGSSFSPMDKKVIGYKCDIDVIGRGIIESIYDFEIVKCDLTI